ncbi:MAG: WD40/YVTN/BNR-like repeat-containing protein, partial [Ktedonobacteraceae bacterium]
MMRLRLSLFLFIPFILAACSGSNLSGPTANAALIGPPVNGFGIEQNHVHSMVILPDANHTIVLATHYGIFRSLDHGVTWQQTAAGPNQLMQGLMTYSLSYNPLDPQRLYVLTQPATIPYSGTLGLYTSSDAGKTWQLSIPTTRITSGFVYLAQAGNESPSEVYIYLSQFGTHGLQVSMDNGRHFSQVGSPLPFGELLGLMTVPNELGHLIVYGNNGIATTSDSGKHWQLVPGILDSIFELTTSGPTRP